MTRFLPEEYVDKISEVNVHGQAQKGNPIGAENYIVTMPNYKTRDSATFLKTAPENVLLAFSQKLSSVFNESSETEKGQILLIHFTKVENIAENNLINVHIPEVHAHMVLGDLQYDKQHVQTKRSFHPYANHDVYENIKEDKEFLQNISRTVDDFSAYELPAHMAEAPKHFAIAHEGYRDLQTFLNEASREEKLSLWENVKNIATPLIAEFGGCRLGYYNMSNQITQKMGHMVLEITSGGQLGHQGKPARWFQAPKR